MTKQVNSKAIVADLLTANIPFDLNLARAQTVPPEHQQTWDNFIRFMTHPLAKIQSKNLTKQQQQQLDKLHDKKARGRLYVWAFS